mgnify:CR=1 FL=1
MPENPHQGNVSIVRSTDLSCLPHSVQSCRNQFKFELAAHRKVLKSTTDRDTSGLVWLHIFRNRISNSVCQLFCCDVSHRSAPEFCFASEI